ncbi:MAG TPA: xanthine dehydrogenase family protein molybdopterin-binding subunit [Thermoanaerobaculia bacterium]|nr:xanthine dehydrogenase family protein molybdopterin-binding subunit [Thermoanaerobaculia bacterium]
MSHIGKDTPLVDGRPKVTGAIRYAGDLVRPGLLHARLATSPYAHARLLSIDAAAALRLPGVVRVLTAKDLPPIPVRGRAQLLLARDRVMFHGQPVALVLADSEAAAQDGADAIVTEYEPLPPVLDIEAALRSDAPALWPEGIPGGSAEEAAAHGAGGGGAQTRSSSPNVANRVAFERGDLTAGFAAAEVVVEREYHTASVHQGYLEPQVTLVDHDPLTGGLDVYTSTQSSFYVRDTIAAMVGLDPGSVRVVATPVGGGFGGKFVLYQPLVALAAKLTGRPVRLQLTRMEEMLAANPAPPTRLRVKLGATRDGRITALDAEMVMDSGCFPSAMAMLSGYLLGSNYTIPNQRIVGIEVVTCKPSGGAYRAPLAPQCAFALETALDELAVAIAADPLELRQRHASRPGDPMATRQAWPGMGLSEVLEALAAHPAWRDRDLARAAGRGVGIAVAGWPGGTEPAAAACALDSSGGLEIHVGSVDITGTNTALGLLAAEAFGLDPEHVRVVAGDTRSGPFAGSSGGSKILYTVGPAVIQAVEEARQQTLELASQMLEADPADLEIADGNVRVKGSPDSAVPLAKIAQRTMSFGSRHAPVFGHGRHAQKGNAPGFCGQLAEVEVDRDTGEVKLHRLVVIQDAGRAINPASVRGQMAGGAVQGLGWGLFEGLMYDQHGQLVTATFTDYALPRVEHTPEHLELQIVEVPAESGPFGARGVGEPPVIATAAAVANAIADATRVRLTELPMTAPRVRQALAARDAGA